MTSLTYYFCTDTVKSRICLMSYQRNLSSLDFFDLFVLLIWRGQWAWFWLRHRLWGFLYRLICHLGLLYHYRVSCVLGVLHHFYFLPSFFLLGVLPKRHMWGVSHIRYIGFSWLHIVLAWHFLPSDFVFFYSAANKPTKSGRLHSEFIEDLIYKSSL